VKVPNLLKTLKRFHDQSSSSHIMDAMYLLMLLRKSIAILMIFWLQNSGEAKFTARKMMPGPASEVGGTIDKENIANPGFSRIVCQNINRTWGKKNNLSFGLVNLT
jgi:hypothetical protein